jgi:hypothetical protein
VAFLRTLPTVREIVTVERGGEWARVARRTDAGWREERVGPDGLLVLASVDWTVPLAELRWAVAD